MMKRRPISILAFLGGFLILAALDHTPVAAASRWRPLTLHFQVSCCPGGAPCPDKGAAAPLKTFKGTIKADGDKIRFVTDADQKDWEVINPETLKGHEGHHVQISAHVYAEKNSLHVMSVKMLKAAKDKSSM
jgi:hypothetical protein